MRLILLLLLIILTNMKICKSRDNDVNCVYKNLYGCRNNKYPRLLSMAKLTKGVVDFGLKILKLLSEELEDTTPKTNEEYDFIVVGAGSAGAAIAARLSEINDATVLLIEAGGAENLVLDVPLLVQYLQFSRIINWDYHTEPSDSYCLASRERRCRWPRGKVMGGSSVLNYMLATKGHPKDYDGWAAMGNTGWSYNETLKYFKKLEDIGMPELRRDKTYHNTNGPLYISELPFHTAVAEAFLKAGVEQGYPIIDYNGEKRIGFSYFQCNIKNGERMSANRAYLHPNRRRKNLFLSKHSHVNKVLINPGSKEAYGVEFTKAGRSIRVLARREVILSAGAIGSPQILMLSGVGPADHLNAVGIQVIQDAPVGKNLMDHIIYPALIFLIDQPATIVTKDIIDIRNPYLSDYFTRRAGPIGIPGAIEALAFIDTDKPNDLEAYPNVELMFAGSSIITDSLLHYLYGMSNDTYWESTFENIVGEYSWSILPVLMRPGHRGRLLLRDRNPESQPILYANYFDDPKDMKDMVKAIRASIEISKTKAMQRFNSRLAEARHIPGCDGHEYDSDGYWECAVRAFGSTLFHQCGTCKMAPENDGSGVVNPRLQVKGIKRLRVADASIMPTIITGHTNIPTIMIAEKLADMVKEDWGYINAN